MLKLKGARSWYTSTLTGPPRSSAALHFSRGTKFSRAAFNSGLLRHPALFVESHPR